MLIAWFGQNIKGVKKESENGQGRSKVLKKECLWNSVEIITTVIGPKLGVLEKSDSLEER